MKDYRPTIAGVALLLSAFTLAVSPKARDIGLNFVDGLASVNDSRQGFEVMRAQQEALEIPPSKP